MKAAGCDLKAVYFDNWYAASDTLNLIHRLQWVYVTRSKCNRVFEGAQVRNRKFFDASALLGRLKGMKHMVQIVKHGNRFLATNGLVPHTTRSLARYVPKSLGD